MLYQLYQIIMKTNYLVPKIRDGFGLCLSFYTSVFKALPSFSNILLQFNRNSNVKS